MPRPVVRPFTLLDAMVLIAFIGIAVSVSRDYWNADSLRVDELFGPQSTTPDQHLLTRDWLWRIGSVAGIFTFFVSFTLFVLQLKRPRPPINRLARNAGFLALVAVIVSDAMILATTAATLWAANGRPILAIDEVMSSWAGGHFVNGLAVAAVWVSLGLARRFRIDPGWIDRSGVLIGIFWIALCVYAGIAVPFLARLL